MNKHSNKTKLIRRGFALIALSCTVAFSATALAACDDDDDDTSTSKTDNCKIANGNFEYYSDDDFLSVINSPDSWTKSVGNDGNGNSASSSIKASGIINTDEELWTEMTTSTHTATSVSDAENNWDDMTVKDRLYFYEQIEDGDYEDSDDIDELSDFDLYEDYTYGIDYDDLPDCENPLTRDGAAEDESSVLMIHNYRTDGYGTAQKYTSSTTITLEKNTSAVFSVWVKTEDLTYNDGKTVGGNRGAYIGITHTVGDVTMDEMQITDIDTSSVTENNGWKQYTVYLKGCTYSSSTFTVVLGLGKGSTQNRFEYVQGYAFFDDVECTLLTNAEYDAATQSAGTYTVPYCTTFTDATEKIFDVYGDYSDNTTFALDMYQGFSSFDITNDTSVDISLTKETYNGISYTTTNYKGLGISTENDVTEVTSLASLKNTDNSYLKSVVNKDFENYPFASSEDMIMLLSADGAAYTAEMKANSDAFTLGPDSYKMISFWVKTSALDSFTGASITLVDGDNESSIAAFDSTTVATINLDDEEDLFDGWVQCFFFVQNETKVDQSFYLKFSYGPTTIVGTTKADYGEGYAAFTNFEALDMNSDEFALVSTGDQAVSVSLSGNSNSSTYGFDSTIYSDTDAIEEGLATPLNYMGVDGGSTYVGGTEYSYANSNEYAGLINKEYATNYAENYTSGNWLDYLLKAEDISITSALSTVEWWNRIFGSSTQPLLIVNAVEQSYGYIASSTTSFSSSSYTTLSVKVKVSAGAIAYVYLIDTSDVTKGYGDCVNITTPEVTYWYDDNGNITRIDPSDDDYNKKTDIVYKINSNGLYTKADGSDSTYYANLTAYKTAAEYDSDTYSSDTDAGKNLVTDSGTIVYYYHDGVYYAEYDKDNNEYFIQVSDLDHSYARYTSESRYLYTVVDNRDGSLSEGWHTVSFYVNTGDAAKDYRLEVFSGSRDGSVKSAAGSYVAFDCNTPESLSDYYDDILDETLDKITEANDDLEIDKDTGRLVYKSTGEIYENASYYTFTYYDSSDYLRYDENADPTNNYIVYEDEEDDPGNLYSGYTQSEQEETLIYLYYEADGEYTTFVNYAPIDTAVSADSTIDDDDDDDDEDFDYSVLLMVISIILSAVLIFTMIALLVRRIVKRARARKVPDNNVYSAKRRRYARKGNITLADDDEKKE